MSKIPPLIATEEVGPHDHLVGQSLGGSLNPTDANVQTATVTVGLIAGAGILLAIYNPKFMLGIMTGTLGLSILGGYVALTKPSTTG